MLSSAWFFQCFSYLHYCLLSNLPQPCYWGIGTPLCPLGSPEQTSGLAKKAGRFQGHFQNVSIYCTSLHSCIPSPSLIFSLSIITIIWARPHCAGAAQTQNDKDSPYLIDFTVENLLCWALNRTYVLQGMQVSISSLGVGEASHQTQDGLSRK